MQGPGDAVCAPAMQNAFEDQWVQEAMAASLLDVGGAAAQPASPAAGDGREFWATRTAVANEDEELQRALAASAVETVPSELGGMGRCSSEEDPDLQRALRESAGVVQATVRVRRLMAPEGPFYPAGLLNSGNSCFWNALVQALFAATPVFRGALFQLDFGDGRDADRSGVLRRLRDLFAEMDMGLAGAIDAGELYRLIFKRAEEADVSEQMQRLFELATGGPGPLKEVCRELFSGDLYERLRNEPTPVRRVPLEFCQLDLCVTEDGAQSLEQLLDEHTRDVQGNITSRSYRLPPVLWLNLDRFVYDREAQRGRKRRARLTFPDVLNVWMLVPPEERWVQELRGNAMQRTELHRRLSANRTDLAARSAKFEDCTEDDLLKLVEGQEVLAHQIEELDRVIALQGAEQELLYQLQAVIVHRGRVDTGHYFAYARAPKEFQPGRAAWVSVNDAEVEVCDAVEMRRICEGEPPAAQATAPRPGAPDDDCGAGEGSPTPPKRTEPRAVGRGRPPPGRAPPGRPQRSVWNSLGSVLGCWGAKTHQEDTDTEEPSAADIVPGREECYPPPPVDPGPPKAVERAERQADIGAAETPPDLGVGVPPHEEDLAAARCLVYVRTGVGQVADRLLAEVRMRVPQPLQEQIDAKNVEFLRKSAGHVAEDFAACVRQLLASPREGEECRQALREAVAAAEAIRAEGGMVRARVHLLRACWRLHFQWLPEELMPASSPPDFRMHYGAAAKKALLDALIRLGQHDMASLIASTTEGSDSFMPEDVNDWLATRGYT